MRIVVRGVGANLLHVHLAKHNPTCLFPEADRPARFFCNGKEIRIVFAAGSGAVATDIDFGFIFDSCWNAVEDGQRFSCSVSSGGFTCCGEDRFGAGVVEGCGVRGEGCVIALDEGEE